MRRQCSGDPGGKMLATPAHPAGPWVARRNRRPGPACWSLDRSISELETCNIQRGSAQWHEAAICRRITDPTDRRKPGPSTCFPIPIRPSPCSSVQDAASFPSLYFGASAAIAASAGRFSWFMLWNALCSGPRLRDLALGSRLTRCPDSGRTSQDKKLSARPSAVNLFVLRAGSRPVATSGRG